jgi:hypothetical protein
VSRVLRRIQTRLAILKVGETHCEPYKDEIFLETFCALAPLQGRDIKFQCQEEGKIMKVKTNVKAGGIRM